MLDTKILNFLYKHSLSIKINSPQNIFYSVFMLSSDEKNNVMKVKKKNYPKAVIINNLKNKIINSNNMTISTIKKYFPIRYIETIAPKIKIIFQSYISVSNIYNKITLIYNNKL